MTGRPSGGDDTIVLWRPVGPDELALVAASGWQRFPPRLPEQPLLYPVLDRSYAVEIARDWNLPAHGIGYVLRFCVERSFLNGYETHVVGAKRHTEYWIPATDLERLNDHIAGRIEVTDRFEE